MLKSFTRTSALIRSAAVPLVAAVVFTFGWTVSSAPDGSLGPAAAEAKSDKAKGKKSGGSKIRAAKSDRKTGKKDRTAKTDRKKERTAKSDRKTERAAKADRISTKGERKAKVTAEEQETASVEESRDAYWDEQDRRYGGSHDDPDHGHTDDEYGDDIGYSDGGDGDGDEVVSKRNWGATASQLKHRNAANANENAFRNASPNSNVGRIATYREAARATIDKEASIDDLNRRLDDLHYDRQMAEADGDWDRVAEINDEVLRLEDERFYAEEDLDHLRATEGDAYRAVGGPDLDAHDYAVFRHMLGLD